jgi:sirohydrochlorin ferrochelatase
MDKSRLNLFAQGSRDSRWPKPFEKPSTTMAAQLGANGVRLACLELIRPTLFDPAEEAARDSLLYLRVLPLFLSSGAQVADEITTQGAEAQSLCPQLHFEVLPPVGKHLGGLLRFRQTPATH